MSTVDHTKLDIAFDPRSARMDGYTAHGNHYFDIPFISEIGPNLWQGGCENNLILPEFFSHLISVYPWESYAIKHELDSLLAVQMFDSLNQSFEQIEAIANWVNVCKKSGPVLVHCQAGLNRSSLIVARSLMLEGASSNEAINLIRAKRSQVCLCNKSFEKYLRGLDK